MAEGQEPDFHVLMQRFHAGDEDAAREILDQYGPHILRVIRRKLQQNEKLRTRFDSQDFMQEVWTSFFAKQPEQKAFDRPEALVKFLANMAYHKVVDAFRRQVQARKHTTNVEQSLDSYKAKRGSDLVGRQPTPSRVVSAREQWADLLRDKPRHYREILVLLGQGNNYTEIARKLGLNERTIRRLVRRLSPEADA